MSPDNNFVLTWDEPPGADPDLNYEVFRDSGAGFQSIGLIGPSDNTTFTDFTVDAAVVNTYRVRSVLDGAFSDFSEELSNIVLTMDASQSSVAQLAWNAPLDPVPAGATFEVFRALLGGAFENVASLPGAALSYRDTLWAQCEDTVITYYVELQHGDCVNVSRRRSDEFRDILPPPQPIIETASVDPETNDIILYWAPVQVPDLDFYRIQDIDLINQQFVNVGVVQAGENTQFVYPNAGAVASRTLAVIAFDQCGNDASFGGTATTIFAEAEYTECDLNAMVSWSAYEGWDEGVEKYLILATIDGEEAVEMAEAEGEESFALVEVEPNREYCFHVEAVSAGEQRNASSNRACVETTYPQISEYTYLSSVSVLDNSRLEVRFLQDTEAEGTRYELFRSRQSGGFLKIASFDQSDVEEIVFTDEGLDTRNLRYRYRVDTYDGCDQPLGQSNFGVNITLNTFAETRELKNFLSWSAYEDWENGVERYEIWRKVGDAEDFELYDEVGGETLLYEDDVEAFLLEEGEFCYQVIAIEAGNSFGEAGRSLSYPRCATQEPIMWIPSAIAVNGQPENRVFKPVVGFIDFDSYRMEIYTKWGQRIFTSDNVEEGWDGTFRGNIVREDFYRYIISYRDGSGKPFVEHDVLYVVK